MSTYNCWIHKRSPIVTLLEKSQHEGDSGRSQQDDDQLVLELLENEFPDRCRRVLWQRYTASLAYKAPLKSIADPTILSILLPRALHLVIRQTVLLPDTKML